MENDVLTVDYSGTEYQEETIAATNNNGRKKRPGKVKKFFKKNAVGWTFVLPLVIGLLVFTVVPMVCSLVFSFFDIKDGFETFIPIGFKNYQSFFGIDWKENSLVLKNTFLYAIISVPLNLILSYFLALLVNRKSKATGFFRVLYYLPVIIPGIVAGLLWKDLTDVNNGIFNRLLNMIGIPSFTWFNSEKTSMFSLIFMNCFTVGGGMILWLSAFKGIPSSLYESAKIEGANKFQQFLHITIPLSTPMIFYNLIMSIIGTLQINSTLAFVPNGGKGVENELYFFGVKIYKTAFTGRNNIDYACAQSWIMFIIIAILTGIMFASSKWVYYQDNKK